MSDDLVNEQENIPLPVVTKSQPLLCITAGSQGAKTLYEALLHLFETQQELLNSFRIVISLGQLNQELAKSFKALGENVLTYDFLTQSQMGKVYQEADLCITRGGTTSLAEQKLFQVKSLIIPLPWTHDQAYNAEYYVQNYGDMVIDQSAPNFIQELEQALRKHTSYHKPTLRNSPLQQIQQTKKLIWEDIFSSRSTHKSGNVLFSKD